MTRAEFDATCAAVKADGCPRNFDLPKVDRWVMIHRTLSRPGVHRLLFSINGQPSSRAQAEALVTE